MFLANPKAVPFRGAEVLEEPLVLERSLLAARSWLGLAVAALVLAGAVALWLVLARLPGIASHVADPLMAKRGLVVHVNLSLIFWLTAFLSAMVSWLGGGGRMLRFGAALAATGAIVLIATALIPGTQPLLSNYIPALDHPLFLVAILLLAAGAVLPMLQALAFESRLGFSFPGLDAAAPLLRGAALAFIIALVTFHVSWYALPYGLAPHPHYELLFWGGGHVLQTAHMLGMLAAWYLLAASAGLPLPSPRLTSWVAMLTVLPLLAMPLLTLRGASNSLYIVGATNLMRWGTWPAVLLLGSPLLRSLWIGFKDKEKAAARSGAYWTLASSMALIITGFLLGAFIRGPNTLVPAHYHAAIGAVTCAYMGVALFVLAPALGLRESGIRLTAWARHQPWIYAMGQWVFAIGFGFAGIHGAARKAYGSDQVLRGTAEKLGMGVMGLGGGIAVLSGILFLVIMSGRLRSKKSSAKGPAMPFGLKESLNPIVPNSQGGHHDW